MFKCECGKDGPNNCVVDLFEENMCNDCFDEMQETHVLCSSCDIYDSRGSEPREGEFICQDCRS